MDPRVKELTLLLIYLTSWEEDSRKKLSAKVARSWKGYNFDIINELDEENLIRQFPKSLILTKEGRLKGESLKRKYLGS